MKTYKLIVDKILTNKDKIEWREDKYYYIIVGKIRITIELLNKKTYRLTFTYSKSEGIKSEVIEGLQENYGGLPRGMSNIIAWIYIFITLTAYRNKIKEQSKKVLKV